MIQRLKRLFIRYSEMVTYLFFGGITTLINMVVYALCKEYLGIMPEVSNVLAWCVSVMTAFITNKLFVFNSRSFETRRLLDEFFKFIFARLLTGLMDQGIYMLFYTVLGFNDYIVKICGMVFVIISNYFLSKLLVFAKKKPKMPVRINKKS